MAFRGTKLQLGEARVVGLDKLSAKFRALPGRYLRLLAGALFVEAEQIMTESRPLVPVDKGHLRASGHVQLPVFEPNRVLVRFGYGGPAGSGGAEGQVGYAVPVHEDERVFGTSPGGGTRNLTNEALLTRALLSQRGKRRKRRASRKKLRTFVGQAKYLSTPFLRRVRGPGLRARLRARVQLRFGGA